MCIFSLNPSPSFFLKLILRNCCKNSGFGRRWPKTSVREGFGARAILRVVVAPVPNTQSNLIQSKTMEHVGYWLTQKSQEKPYEVLWSIGAELRGLFCESSLHFLTSDILNKMKPWFEKSLCHNNCAKKMWNHCPHWIVEALNSSAMTTTSLLFSSCEKWVR